MERKLILNPQAIVDQEFHTDFQGYNAEQVDLMLDDVIKDYQTYDAMLQEYHQRIMELENTNASLNAKIIDLESQLRMKKDEDPILQGASNVDILKRLSRLEQQVFNNNK